MTKTITAYTFDELPPEAQERALRDMPYDDDYPTVMECVASLEAFASKLGFTLRDWSIGDLRSSRTKFDLDDAVRDLSGARAFAWIENNVFGPLRQGWHWRKNPKGQKPARAYTQPGHVKACPFTGVCFDEDILDAFRDKDPRLTIGERFASIGDRLTRVIEAEAEYRNSDEGRRERAEFEFDGVLFDEDGREL